jgi:hypothetical protein
VRDDDPEKTYGAGPCDFRGSSRVCNPTWSWYVRVIQLLNDALFRSLFFKEVFIFFSWKNLRYSTYILNLYKWYSYYISEDVDLAAIICSGRVIIRSDDVNIVPCQWTTRVSHCGNKCYCCPYTWMLYSCFETTTECMQNCQHHVSEQSVSHVQLWKKIYV